MNGTTNTNRIFSCGAASVSMTQPGNRTVFDRIANAIGTAYTNWVGEEPTPAAAEARVAYVPETRHSTAA